jgi:phosphonate transport system substrate-binding protein
MISKVLVFLLLFPVIVFSQELVFATYPSNSTEKIEKSFSVLAEHLAEKTGYKIKLTVTKDYQELADRIKDGTADIAWMGSVNYIKTKKSVPDVTYVATYMENGENTDTPIPYYQSFIVAMKHTGLKTYNDIKCKMFAFVDRDSTSGYAYPMMMLRSAGIDPADHFKKVFLLKKHDRVVKALVRGSIDAGSISDGTYYNAVKEYGDVFQIIAKSEPIPLDAIIVTKKAPAGLADEIRKILTEIPEDHRVNQAIKQHLEWPAAGFSVKSDSFYDGMRKALGM